MSTQPSSEPKGKQPPSIYTVFLLLSMLFMLIAVIAMFVELNRWAPDYYNTNQARPSVMVAPAGDWKVASKASPASSISSDGGSHCRTHVSSAALFCRA